MYANIRLLANGISRQRRYKGDEMEYLIEANEKQVSREEFKSFMKSHIELIKLCEKSFQQNDEMHRFVLEQQKNQMDFNKKTIYQMADKAVAHERDQEVFKSKILRNEIKKLKEKIQILEDQISTVKKGE